MNLAIEKSQLQFQESTEVTGLAVEVLGQAIVQQVTPIVDGQAQPAWPLPNMRLQKLRDRLKPRSGSSLCNQLEAGDLH